MTTTPSGFADLGVPADLCAPLHAAGITVPTPIQHAVIPDALRGRDVTGRAPTGSGKTLAFGLPLVARLRAASASRPTALVLA
ncbi:MAG: DEAD/DEAH box helicase, partial [Acidimicrobiia bacterium]|nr:DEAD/DEAH box helicase [Acidimicrobiia bacterium]